MKKKNLRKLSLNKTAVSNLEKVNGGNPEPAPVTNPLSGCPVCPLPAVTDNTCLTNCFVSCFLTCKASCFPCW